MRTRQGPRGDVASSGVAPVLEPALRSVLGQHPAVGLRFWDGSTIGPADGRSAVVVRSPDALRRLLYAPNELGLGRAYVAGELDVEGSVFDVLRLRDALGAPEDNVAIDLGPHFRSKLLAAMRKVGGLGLPLRPPPEEARLRGRLHSKGRDAQAISHHYNVSNDFYRLVLGESMTYSCAYYADDHMSLVDAQRAKYEHISRKLGLTAGMRLLDVGCGWGGMLLHAAENNGVHAVGITLSRPQAELARARVERAGLAEHIDVRVQDYRDLRGERFDAISSIGMFEHVGVARLEAYFSALFGVLEEGGRLLNHAISRPPGTASNKHSFASRFVFPDGELQEVGSVVSAMQRQRFEVRDVESLREHYGRTLRSWVANLESQWDEAQRLVGSGRARVWRLYMAGSALGFEAGRLNLHQVLGVKTRVGASHMPPTRASLYA
ncbi:MAG: class I SAM-dependent methyltransferase [Actinomycetota bacterium]